MDDEIKVKARKDDNKVYFESSFIQSISNHIDMLVNDINNLIKQNEPEFKEIDIIESIDHISDLKDDITDILLEFVKSEELINFLEESSREIKIGLNRDADYINRSKRKLDKLDNDEYIDYKKTNLKIIELCDKAIRLNDLNPEPYYLKGLALINLKEYTDGIEFIIDSLALGYDNLNAYIHIADANRFNNDYEDAISVYDYVLEKDEKSYDALTGKAYTYLELDDVSNAKEFFKKGNDIKSLDDEALNLWKSL